MRKASVPLDDTSREDRRTPFRIAVLIVCHNRINCTLRALRSLQCDEENIELKVVLFDDGSTDGTREAVAAQFPATIIMIGDGTKFWNEGLYHAWTRALELDADAYLWLNDDVVLNPDALDRIITTQRDLTSQGLTSFVLAGCTRGASGDITYGGYELIPSPFSLKLQHKHPDRDLTPIDTFNGNIVFVTRGVVGKIGINDPRYFHNFGDNDYGLRVRAARIPIFLMKEPLGFCERNELKNRRGFGSIELSLAEQWAVVNTPRGLPFASWWRFTRKFSGIWFPLHFILPYRHLLVPRSVRRMRKIFARTPNGSARVNRHDI